MADPYKLAERLRQQLLANDRETAGKIAAAYEKVYRAAQLKIEYYTNRVRAAEQALRTLEHGFDATRDLLRSWGDDEATIARKIAETERIADTDGRFTKLRQELAASLFESERWKATEREIAALIDDYGRVAAGHTENAQGEAINLGRDHTIDQLENEIAGYAFGRPDPGALQAMVGFTGDGAPLTDLFNRLAPESLDMVRDTLRTAIGLGSNPGVTARMLAGPLGIPLWRGLTIARTETLRAYRESQRSVIEQNADVLEGWVWHSARDIRTCEVCWANDGTLFPLHQSETA